VKAKLRAGGCAAAVGEPVAPLAADRAAPAAQRAQVKSKELEARQRAALARNLLKQLAAGKVTRRGEPPRCRGPLQRPVAPSSTL
jgi:hypothetical protein